MIKIENIELIKTRKNVLKKPEKENTSK